jgi:hypothetical protein
MGDQDKAAAGSEVLGGRYTLEERIGGGSSASVYRAADRRTGGVVAVKVLDPENAAVETEVKRFVQEAQLAAQIRHPNLVPTYDFGGIGGRYYIAMELVQGESLAARLGAEKRIEPRRAACLILDVLDALAALHQHGVAHRDISPTNVLIESVGGRERARLSDLGLAKKLTERDLALTDVPPTKPVTAWGTRGYVAPECVMGDPNDLMSDIYSVGAVWYKMVTGYPPASLREDERGEWPPLVHRLDDMPAAMRAVLLGALAVRDRRHHSAAAMAAALRVAMEVRPRRPGYARALAAGLVVLLALQTWASMRPSVDVEARPEPLPAVAAADAAAAAEARPEQLLVDAAAAATRPARLPAVDAQLPTRNTADVRPGRPSPRARGRSLRSALVTCKPANVASLEVVLDPGHEVEIDGGAPFGDLGRCVLREVAKYPPPGKRMSLTL